MRQILMLIALAAAICLSLSTPSAQEQPVQPVGEINESGGFVAQLERTELLIKARNRVERLTQQSAPHSFFMHEEVEMGECSTYASTTPGMSHTVRVAGMGGDNCIVEIERYDYVVEAFEIRRTQTNAHVKARPEFTWNAKGNVVEAWVGVLGEEPRRRPVQPFEANDGDGVEIAKNSLGIISKESGIETALGDDEFTVYECMNATLPIDIPAASKVYVKPNAPFGGLFSIGPPDEPVLKLASHVYISPPLLRWDSWGVETQLNYDSPAQGSIHEDVIVGQYWLRTVDTSFGNFEEKLVVGATGDHHTILELHIDGEFDRAYMIQHIGDRIDKLWALGLEENGEFDIELVNWVRNEHSPTDPFAFSDDFRGAEIVDDQYFSIGEDYISVSEETAESENSSTTVTSALGKDAWFDGVVHSSVRVGTTSMSTRLIERGTDAKPCADWSQLMPMLGDESRKILSKALDQGIGRDVYLRHLGHDKVESGSYWKAKIAIGDATRELRWGTPHFTKEGVCLVDFENGDGLAMTFVLERVPAGAAYPRLQDMPARLVAAYVGYRGFPGTRVRLNEHSPWFGSPECHVAHFENGWFDAVAPMNAAKTGDWAPPIEARKMKPAIFEVKGQMFRCADVEHFKGYSFYRSEQAPYDTLMQVKQGETEIYRASNVGVDEEPRLAMQWTTDMSSILPPRIRLIEEQSEPDRGPDDEDKSEDSGE